MQQKYKPRANRPVAPIEDEMEVVAARSGDCRHSAATGSHTLLAPRAHPPQGHSAGHEEGRHKHKNKCRLALRSCIGERHWHFYRST